MGFTLRESKTVGPHATRMHAFLQPLFVR